MSSVGDVAPDFALLGSDNTPAGRRTYSLAEYRGRPLVLVFYPGDQSPICTRQLNTYTADIASFAAAGAQVVAISPQSVTSHEAFSERQGGFGFPLLADTGKAVGKAYRILGPLGLYRRSAFVIDAVGIIRYAHKAVAGFDFRSSEELVAAVQACSV
ncbi:MAG: peroxiredoxin [Acidimicrobiia bacterium]|nr:peroxiredoxin [Acidimicrobiia bacterium]